MDLYTDFLTSSPNIVSATLFSEVLNKSYSHDSITRMLAQPELDQKTYWKHVKSSVRQLESPNGVLSIDDTIEEKPYSDEKELISWHFDHTKGYSVKGINILTFTYVNNELPLTAKLPVAYELVRKDGFQTKTVKKDGKFEQKPRDVQQSLKMSCFANDCMRWCIKIKFSSEPSSLIRGFPVRKILNTLSKN
jgi:hypothetical protein